MNKRPIHFLMIFCVTLFTLQATAQQFEPRRFRRAQGIVNAQVQPFTQELTVNGQVRSFILRKPEMISGNSQKYPLVIALHGGGGNAQNAQNMMGWTELGQREGFIVAYPNGTGRRENVFLTFNAKHCCHHAMQTNVDDVAFISALIDKLVRDENIDPRRVYVTGMSNGAMMAHRLGAELSEKITAIAPVVGTIFGDEQIPRSKVSAIIINGALDENVPPAGGVTGSRNRASWDDTPMLPTFAQSSFWARVNGCTNPQTIETVAVNIVRYQCSGAVAVEQHIVKDNGHAWPGGKKGGPMGDEPSQSVNATNLIWNFFRIKVK